MDENGKRTIKERFEDFKAELRWKKMEAQAWARDHRDELVGAAIFLIPTVTKLVQTSNSKRKHSDEERHRNRSVYDPQHHHSYECKRDLKSYEWAEIDRRRDAGESVYDILTSMRLL